MQKESMLQDSKKNQTWLLLLSTMLLVIPSTITRDTSNMLYAVLLPNYHSTFYYLYFFELFVYQSSVNIGIYKLHMIGLLCLRRRNVSTRSFLGATSENRRGPPAVLSKCVHFTNCYSATDGW